MNDVDAIVDRLKGEWGVARPASHGGVLLPVSLRCSFENPASEAALQSVSAQAAVPPQLLAFWTASNGARLFEDEQYGQWGLRLYSASESLQETSRFAQDRPADVQQGDLVIGEFLGDSDLLIIRCDPSLESYGSMIVALPLDDRADWDRVSPDFGSFLLIYSNTNGEKFWRKS